MSVAAGQRSRQWGWPGRRQNALLLAQWSRILQLYVMRILQVPGALAAPLGRVAVALLQVGDNVTSGGLEAAARLFSLARTWAQERAAELGGYVVGHWVGLHRARMEPAVGPRLTFAVAPKIQHFNGLTPSLTAAHKPRHPPSDLHNAREVNSVSCSPCHDLF